MQLNKRKLYEDIMQAISKEVKHSLNENASKLSQDDILHYMEGGHKDEIIAAILFNILSQNEAFKLYFEDYKKFKSNMTDMYDHILNIETTTKTKLLTEDIFYQQINQIKDKLDNLLYTSKP